MRINTSGPKAYRNDLYERTADVLGENTKTGAIDAACIHAKQDIEGKRDTISYLASELPPEKLRDVAEMLSTEQVKVTAAVDTDVSVSE